MGVSRVNFQARKAIFNNKDLGILDGPIEISLERDDHEVMDDRIGPEALAIINRATKITVKVKLKEVDKAQYKDILDGVLLKSVTPTGVGATEVLAVGTEFNGTNLMSAAKMLVLKEMDSDDEDHSTDFCFWKAIAKLDGGMSFSANEETKLGITFTIVPDDSKAANINKFVIGDYTQFVTP